MSLSMYESDFIIERDDEKCIRCEVCVRQCGFDAHTYYPEYDEVESDNLKCPDVTVVSRYARRTHLLSGRTLSNSEVTQT